MGGWLIGPKATDLWGLSHALEIPAPLVTTIYTNAHSLNHNVAMGVSMKATVAAGAPDLDVWLEQSWYKLSNTEENLAHATYVVPESVAKIIDITDELWHHFLISAIVLPFLRFKIIGQAANPASCTVQVKLTTQEQV